MWLSYMTFQWVANSYVAWDDTQGRGFQWWEPVLWEGSSSIIWVCLLPLMLWFDNKYPLRLNNLKTNVLKHLAFTIPFSVLHVLGMVAIRKVTYALNGGSYDFGSWPAELMYEYIKDVRSYAMLLAMVYLYRFIIFRMQGEIGLLDKPDNETSETVPFADRLLVKKLGKEFLIQTDEIDWLEACGNYVNLNVDGRVYPFRGTMKELDERLSDDKFLRIHRSYIVNLNRVSQIEPQETGDAIVHLTGDHQLPFSRRYRSQWKQQQAG